MDAWERERVLTLAEIQDLRQENDRLRQLAQPTIAFPPAPSVPPSGPKPAPATTATITDPPKRHARWKETAIGLGIAAAMGWNAFLSHKTLPKADKVDAVAARQKQNEQQASERAVEEALARQERELLVKVMRCWGQQLRGASQRNGLDLPSLPAGGITVKKLAAEDPNRPGAPAFIVADPCPQLPDTKPTP